MFDRQNDVTNKIPLALRARASGDLGTGRLYLGGRFVGTVIREDTNTAGKFPILSRFPASHSTGTSDTYGVINEISLGATLTLPMVTAYAQGEYSELIFPGQSDVQLRKYWLAVGDLGQSPFYAAIGRKTVNFGDFFLICALHAQPQRALLLGADKGSAAGAGICHRPDRDRAVPDPRTSRVPGAQQPRQ
ncbi:hypothetical protein ACFOHS_13210 [Jhaorihella thermophila]